MRKIIVLLCLTTLLSCKSKKPISGRDNPVATKKSLVLVKPEEVDAIKKKRAYELGKRLLETCNTSHFKTFTREEATEKVIKNATQERISATCQKIIFRNGKFISLSLLTITHDEINDEYIFRYNIEYEKKYFKRELEVTINSENKVSAMKTKEIKPKPM